MTNEGTSVNLCAGWTDLMLFITKERIFCVIHCVSVIVFDMSLLSHLRDLHILSQLHSVLWLWWSGIRASVMWKYHRRNLKSLPMAELTFAEPGLTFWLFISKICQLCKSWMFLCVCVCVICNSRVKFIKTCVPPHVYCLPKCACIHVHFEQSDDKFS